MPEDFKGVLPAIEESDELFHGGAYMSVEIFDVDDLDFERCSRICIPVAGEETFNSIWETALRQLNINRLGNGVWLHKDDLELILSDFCRIREWAEGHPEMERADDVISHIDYILEKLPFQWEKNPYITRLWMG